MSLRCSWCSTRPTAGSCPCAWPRRSPGTSCSCAGCGARDGAPPEPEAGPAPSALVLARLLALEPALQRLVVVEHVVDVVRQIHAGLLDLGAVPADPDDRAVA